LMRLTERLLSARGRGSRVVVTVMLWAMGAGFVCGGGCWGCWARAVLRQTRIRGRCLFIGRVVRMFCQAMFVVYLSSAMEHEDWG
jgi:hypothetical protein